MKINQKDKNKSKIKWKDMSSENKKDKIIEIIGWIILTLTVLSLIALSITAGIISFNELEAGDVAGVPVGIEFAFAMFIATLFALAVVFALVYFFLWEPMNNHLEKRTTNIETNIDAASYKNKEADKNYEKSLKTEKEANREAKEIIGESKQIAVKQKREILNETKLESAKILEQSRSQIEKEKDQMRQEIKQEILETSLIAAEKIIEKELDSDVNNRMIEELISELK